MGFLQDLVGIGGAKKAASAYGDASRGAANQGYSDIQSMYEPYTTQGTSAYNRLADLSGANGASAMQTAQGDFRFSPDYNVRFDQGATALQKVLGGSQGLNSGAAIKAATNYGQQQGALGYNDYYNRLAGLANTGLQSTGAVAGARQGLTNTLTNSYQQEGNTMANASLAGGNFLMNGLGTLAGIAGFSAPGLGAIGGMGGMLRQGTGGNIGGMTAGSQAAYNPYGFRFS